MKQLSTINSNIPKISTDIFNDDSEIIITLNKSSVLNDE